MRDAPGGVGETMPPSKLVGLVLLGLPESWHIYQDFINGKESSQIGRDFGLTWCRRRLEETLEMESHLELMRKKTFP